MRDEKKYLKDLVTELKLFFTLSLKEREVKALDLNDNWGFDIRDYSKIKDWQKKAAGISLSDNSKVSKETENIASSLMVLHHYIDDPKGYDVMIKSILEDAEKQLKKLGK
jgi:hypothetical protein